MRLVGYDAEGKRMLGSVDESGEVLELAPVSEFWLDPDLYLNSGTVRSRGKLSDLTQRAALPPTARIVVVGLNYRQHVMETNTEIPSKPVILARWSNSLIGTGEPAPLIGEQFDWEGELGVVIGRRLFRVDEEQAAAGIFGYAAFNDLSARDWQMESSQWTLGKNTQASGPVGPITTRDEVGDLEGGLRLQTRVNGRVVQDGLTSDLIFSINYLISYLSQAMVLEPGDLIATGTPSGVGLASGTFLEPGDVVEVDIERVGRVTTPIIATPDPIH